MHLFILKLYLSPILPQKRTEAVSYKNKIKQKALTGNMSEKCNKEHMGVLGTVTKMVWSNGNKAWLDSSRRKGGYKGGGMAWV